MNARHWLTGALILISISLIPIRTTWAQAETSQETDQRLKKLIEESIAWYPLLPDANSKTPLHSQTVLRWINASRGQKGEDIMVLWTHAGRPQAAASIFPNSGNMCHEFASLSRDNRLVAKFGAKVVWAPSSPGADFRDLPNAPSPAEIAPARLIQIKSLTERFTAMMTGLKVDNSDREELRLLPRPVYRYDMKEAKTTHADLLDGAVLAFVQGTDPEVLLVLEAIRLEDGPRWQYAFARATSGGLEARLDGKVVWTADKSYGSLPLTSPQLTLRRSITE